MLAGREYGSTLAFELCRIVLQTQMITDIITFSFPFIGYKPWRSDRNSLKAEREVSSAKKPFAHIVRRTVVNDFV